MSGPGQHFIPKLLQRGFLAPDLKGERVWVFPNEGAPRPQRIEEVGKQRNFYSPPSSNEIDDAITALEGRLGAMVAGLRSQSSNAVDAQVAAELVAHLTIRTAHIRDTLGDGVREIATVTYGAFESEENVRRLIGMDSPHMNARFAEKLLPLLEEEPIFKQVGMPSSAIARLAFILARENFSKGFGEEFRPQLTSKLGMMLHSADKLARDSHGKALKKIDEQTPLVDGLASFTWRLVDCDEPAILPDCVAITVGQSGQYRPLFGTDQDTLTTILMPVSSARILVGEKPQAGEIKLHLFNLHAAACSRRFFISSVNTAELSQLVPVMGVLASSAVTEGIRDGAAEFLPPAKATEVLPAPSPGVAEPPLPEGGYQVSCSGHWDNEAGSAIADTVNAIAHLVAKTAPLSRLEGVTFADDYPQAMRDLDRGFPIESPAPAEERHASGLGQAPIIKRDGQIKVRMVMRGQVGDALIGDDEVARQQAFYFVAYLFGLTSNSTLIEHALPGVLLSPFPDRFSAHLYQASLGSYSGYHAARISGPFLREAGFDYREQLLAALRNMHASVPQARLDYRFHGDIGRLLSTVLPCIASVLEVTAQLVGHADHDDENGLGYLEGVAEAFGGVGLGRWFELYQCDLRRLWDRQGRWASLEELLSVNHHVERILMLYGILAWETEAGDMRLTIPLASDNARLPAEAVRRFLARCKGAVLSPGRAIQRSLRGIRAKAA